MCGTIAVLSAVTLAQNRLSYMVEALASQQFEASADTISISKWAAHTDSLDAFTLKLRTWVDAGYRTPPVHPYFRDEYRIIADMRRLVSFVEPNAIIGYESVNELFEIGQRLPESKQTEIIRVAMAGTMADFVSEITSKELRRRKAHFVQWKLDRVVLRQNFQNVYASFYNGVTSKGYSFYYAPLRASYSHQSNKYYSSFNYGYQPFRHFSFSYTNLDGRDIFTQGIMTGIGNIALSFEKDRNLLVSTFDFRQSMSVIIRLLYINFLDDVGSDLFRSEVMLRW